MSVNLDDTINSLAKSYESSRLDELMTFLDQVEASSIAAPDIPDTVSPLASTDLASDVFSGVKHKLEKLRKECQEKTSTIAQLQDELEKERAKLKTHIKKT